MTGDYCADCNGVVNGKPIRYQESEDKPVLPEKLDRVIYIYTSDTNEDTLIKETEKIKKTVNAIIDHLARKEQ